jgi:acetyl esterase/lipase
MPTDLPPATRSDIERVVRHLHALFHLNDTPADPASALKRIRDITDRYGDIQQFDPVSGVTNISTFVDGVAAEWIVPQGAATEDRVLYIHGGGWVAGSLNGVRNFASLFALKTNRAVLLIDYALAPENPFPAGLLDCCKALDWIAQIGPHGAQTAKKLCVMGDSAGGNLAAAVCLDAAETKRRIPDQVVLISPALDTTPNAYRVLCDDIVCDAAGMANAMSLYVQDGTPLTDSRISPLLASDAQLKQFPPALIQVSGAEFLYPDALHFTQRLAGLGRRVNLSVWPDMPHVWHAFVPVLPEAEQAIEEIASFLT